MARISFSASDLIPISLLSCNWFILLLDVSSTKGFNSSSTVSSVCNPLNNRIASDTPSKIVKNQIAKDGYLILLSIKKACGIPYYLVLTNMFALI